MYKADSKIAEEFIDHQEILDTLEYAHNNKSNRALIEQLIDKAAQFKGLSHREAALLLECDQPDLTERIFRLAQEIKHKFYGNRIVMFAPLYLSNYCVNGCVYCPYHLKNKTIARKKLTQEEIRKEVIALQDMGHKRLALEAGEDPLRNPIEYILESIQTIYSIKHKNGAIRRVNVNIAATTVENYRKLKDAGIGTYILFQETYHKENYESLHPTGPKSKYAYHTEAMDRAMEAGIDDVGLGVLFGLNTYRYDFTGLLMHAEHLEATFGVGAHAMTWPASSHCHSILVAPAMERMRASARRTSAGVTPPLSCTGMRHSAQSPRRWQAVASPTNAGVFRHVLSAFDMTIAASMPDARSVPLLASSVTGASALRRARGRVSMRR